MIKKISDNKSIRIIVSVILFAVMLSAAVFTVNGTFASPEDITVTLTQPNNYREIEKNSSYTIGASGITDFEVSDVSIASAAFANKLLQVTGKNAGVVTIAASSSGGYARAYNYQIIDSSKISEYIIKNGGEVSFAGAGKTKPVPVEVTKGTDDIKWSSLNPNVAAVNENTGEITGVKKGAAVILGKFTDKWGVSRDIHILAGVGINLSGSSLGELIDLINKGESILGLDPNPYTDETLNDLRDAVDNGKNVVNKENPADAEIQDAIGDLNDAVNNLEQKPASPAEHSIIEITVIVEPKTIYKVNETFEPSGMILAVLYDDGSRVLADSGYTYQPDKFTAVGENIPVTVTYKGVSAILYVTVKTASALPTDSIPTGVDGRVLTAEKAGDDSDWLEIAQNGGYSLIVRANCVKPNSLFNSTVDSHYAGSLLEQKMNNFYEQLNENSGLKQYAVTSNAVSRIITSIDAASLTNLKAFSVPSTDKPSTPSGAAFALSYQEYARFLSLKNYSGASPDTAINNFKKLKQIGDVDLTESMSRSPYGSGYGLFIQLTSTFYGDKFYDGYFHADAPNLDFAAGIWCHKDYGKGWGVRPAMWVDSAIFE